MAIVVIGTASFAAAGFNRVNVLALEREELQREGKTAPVARALSQRLSRVFESRWGSALRFLMPFVLLGAVYIPLRRALDEVAWQVRVRAAVRESLDSEPLRVVQSRVRVERHAIEIVVVLLGVARDAEFARARFDAHIRQVSGVVPRIEILAVPDATAFAGLESTLLKPQRVAAPPSPPSSSPDEQLSAAQARIRSLVDGLWPTATTGHALSIALGTDLTGPLSVRVVHLGQPLSADGADTLRRALGAAIGQQVLLVDDAVPATELTPADGDLQFVARVASGARILARVPASSVCVIRPAKPAEGSKLDPAGIELERALDEALRAHPRVTTTFGKSWSIRFARAACPAPAAADAGAPDMDGVE